MYKNTTLAVTGYSFSDAENATDALIAKLDHNLSKDDPRIGTVWAGKSVWKLNLDIRTTSADLVVFHPEKPEASSVSLENDSDFITKLQTFGDVVSRFDIDIAQPRAEIQSKVYYMCTPEHLYILFGKVGYSDISRSPRVKHAFSYDLLFTAPRDIIKDCGNGRMFRMPSEDNQQLPFFSAALSLKQKRYHHGL